MARNGKIARLDREVQQELNERLLKNEDGATVLEWLNGLPEVVAVLAEEFEGKAISKQNLSEWRLGGFKEWEFRMELYEQARVISAQGEVIDEFIADDLAKVLTLRMAKLLSDWDGGVTEAFEQQLRVLKTFSQEVSRLQRAAHHSAQQRQELERRRFEEERAEEKREEAELLAPLKSALAHAKMVEAYGGGEAAHKKADIMMLLKGKLTPDMHEHLAVKLGQTDREDEEPI